jgi:hypothetical protein
MALSEQEIIRREKTTKLTQLQNQSLSSKPFSCKSHFKTGKEHFEDGKR